MGSTDPIPSLAGGASRPCVVVADDDPAIRLVCRTNLELEGYRVLEARSADEIARLIREHDVGALLLDVRLGSDDGVALARALRDEGLDVGIGLVSGSDDALEHRAAGLADRVLRKPFGLQELSDTASALVSAHRDRACAARG